jgi:hypothetical protein
MYFSGRAAPRIYSNPLNSDEGAVAGGSPGEFGLELMGVRGALERDGELQLTWPPAHLAASALREALAA